MDWLPLQLPPLQLRPVLQLRPLQLPPVLQLRPLHLPPLLQLPPVLQLPPLQLRFVSFVLQPNVAPPGWNACPLPRNIELTCRQPPREPTFTTNSANFA